MRAAATWLDARPVLGLDVFARGAPELAGGFLEAAYEVDVIAFFWASLTLFDDGIDAVETTALYCPQWLDPHSIPEARDRILRLLARRSVPAACGSRSSRMTVSLNSSIRRSVTSNRSPSLVSDRMFVCAMVARPALCAERGLRWIGRRRASHIGDEPWDKIARCTLVWIPRS
jgi:hypothetical protein